MEFQWYEYEIVDKSRQWTRILDLGECKLQDQIFHLRTDAINYLEDEAASRYRIRDSVAVAYNMSITKLGRNLYMCEAENFRGDKDNRPWVLIRVRKHVARVPLSIVDEQFNKWKGSDTK